MGSLPTAAQVEAVLDEKIRPYLKQHNGDIKVVALFSETIKVKLLGQCSNCPSASAENEEFFEKELRAAFPEIKHVLLETGVSDELIDEAKAILNQRHKGSGDK